MSFFIRRINRWAFVVTIYRDGQCQEWGNFEKRWQAIEFVKAELTYA